MRAGMAWMVGLLAAGPALGMTPEEYAKKHGVTTGDEGQKAAVQKCLQAWGTHPFDTEEPPSFRVIEPKLALITPTPSEEPVGALPASGHLDADTSLPPEGATPRP